MRARQHGVLKVASALLNRLVSRLKDLGGLSIRSVRRKKEELARKRARPPVEVADERTIRRIAEAQGGGLSSIESAARYERGDNPGGTHGRAVRREEGPERLRPGFDEPEERKRTMLHGEKHMSVTRRGA